VLPTQGLAAGDALLFVAYRRSGYTITTVTIVTPPVAVMVVTLVMVYPDLRLRTKNENHRPPAEPVMVVTVVMVHLDLTLRPENGRSPTSCDPKLNASVLR